MYNTEKVIDWHLILLKYQEKKKYFPLCFVSCIPSQANLSFGTKFNHLKRLKCYCSLFSEVDNEIRHKLLSVELVNFDVDQLNSPG